MASGELDQRHLSSCSIPWNCQEAKAAEPSPPPPFQFHVIRQEEEVMAPLPLPPVKFCQIRREEEGEEPAPLLLLSNTLELDRRSQKQQSPFLLLLSNST